MAPPSGSAAFKKKDGTLTMSQDRLSVSWIPSAGGASGAITLPVAQITSTYCLPGIREDCQVALSSLFELAMVTCRNG